MNFIDKYRKQIGLVLIILILIGTGLLLWKQEIFGLQDKKSSNEISQNPNLENEIDNLKKEISRLNETLSKTEIQKTETTTQEVISQGQVAGESTAVGQEAAGKININTADASALDSLPGIGSVYASRIIEYRNSHGGFKNIEEIQNVKGIGPATFEKMKNQITI